jgi:hypothetical protein
MVRSDEKEIELYVSWLLGDLSTERLRAAMARMRMGPRGSISIVEASGRSNQSRSREDLMNTERNGYTSGVADELRSAAVRMLNERLDRGMDLDEATCGLEEDLALGDEQVLRYLGRGGPLGHR